MGDIPITLHNARKEYGKRLVRFCRHVNRVLEGLWIRILVCTQVDPSTSVAKKVAGWFDLNLVFSALSRCLM